MLHTPSCSSIVAHESAVVASILRSSIDDKVQAEIKIMIACLIFLTLGYIKNVQQYNILTRR